jgi:hypothetical protein
MRETKLQPLVTILRLASLVISILVFVTVITAFIPGPVSHAKPEEDANTTVIAAVVAAIIGAIVNDVVWGRLNASRQKR